MMENRTYDNLFGRYPLDPSGGVATLPQAADPFPGDNDHSGPREIALLANGQLNQFATAGTVQYGQSDMPTYWSYAQSFGLGDNFFSSMATLSQPNHLAMIAGQSPLDQNGGDCTSPANAISLQRAASTGVESFGAPCYNITTLPQLLGQNQLSWRYYSNGGIWDAPKIVTSLVNSPNNVLNPDQFLSDVQGGNLAAVSWVTPQFANSDHPPSSVYAGQDYVAQEVNAIMQSPYWTNTVIFVTWDDWGGFYDHVNPQALDADGLGLRAPLLVISPYTRAGYISHNLGEFASFLKFIEENWNLPNLGQRDSLPMLSDLMDYFNFNQTPAAPLLEPTNLPYDSVLVPVANTTGVGKTPPFPIWPAFGTTQTTFTYSVLDTNTVTPSVANVVIDGVAHALIQQGAATSQGTLYQYTTTLGTGSHTYSYMFVDSLGTWAIPDNNTTYAGPVVGNVALDTPQVNPAIALPGKQVTFSIRYTSLTNTAPTQAQIQLDGITYSMTPTPPLTYSAGVTYAYKTSSLFTGTHFYRFVFNDGTGPWIFEGTDQPTITPITITGPNVSPATGSATTPFTFSATYVSSDGSAPSQAASVTIDSNSYPLTFVSGSYATGALYQYTTTLSAGTHTYFFYFANSSYRWASPIYPADFTVTVTSSASGALTTTGSRSSGHTEIAPSHSENPDQGQYPVVPDASTPQVPNLPTVDDDD